MPRHQELPQDMDLQRAEAPAEGDVLFRRQMLATKHQNPFAVEEGSADCGEGRVVERVRQVEIADLGPERRGKASVAEEEPSSSR